MRSVPGAIIWIWNVPQRPLCQRLGHQAVVLLGGEEPSGGGPGVSDRRTASWVGTSKGMEMNFLPAGSQFTDV